MFWIRRSYVEYCPSFSTKGSRNVIVPEYILFLLWLNGQNDRLKCRLIVTFLHQSNKTGFSGWGVVERRNPEIVVPDACIQLMNPSPISLSLDRSDDKETWFRALIRELKYRTVTTMEALPIEIWMIYNTFGTTIWTRETNVRAVRFIHQVSVILSIFVFPP